MGSAWYHFLTVSQPFPYKVPLQGTVTASSDKCSSDLWIVKIKENVKLAPN